MFTVPQMQAELYVQSAAIAGTFRIGLATEMLNYAFTIVTDESAISAFAREYQEESESEFPIDISKFAQHILYQVADFLLCEYQEVMQEWETMFPR